MPVRHRQICERTAAFLQAVEEGEADIRAGRVAPWTDNTLTEIIAEVLKEREDAEKARARRHGPANGRRG